MDNYININSEIQEIYCIVDAFKKLNSQRHFKEGVDLSIEILLNFAANSFKVGDDEKAKMIRSLSKDLGEYFDKYYKDHYVSYDTHDDLANELNKRLSNITGKNVGN